MWKFSIALLTVLGIGLSPAWAGGHGRGKGCYGGWQAAYGCCGNGWATGYGCYGGPRVAYGCWGGGWQVGYGCYGGPAVVSYGCYGGPAVVSYGCSGGPAIVTHSRYGAAPVVSSNRSYPPADAATVTASPPNQAAAATPSAPAPARPAAPAAAAAQPQEQAAAQRQEHPSNRDLPAQTIMPTEEGPTAAAPATIVIVVPEGARLSVNGTPIDGNRGAQKIVSPPLAPGKDYHYSLKAEITRDGQTLVTSQRIAVRAGEERRVTLEFPAGHVSR